MNQSLLRCITRFASPKTFSLCILLAFLIGCSEKADDVTPSNGVCPIINMKQTNSYPNEPDPTKRTIITSSVITYVNGRPDKMIETYSYDKGTTTYTYLYTGDKLMKLDAVSVGGSYTYTHKTEYNWSNDQLLKSIQFNQNKGAYVLLSLNDYLYNSKEQMFRNVLSDQVNGILTEYTYEGDSKINPVTSKQYDLTYPVAYHITTYKYETTEMIQFHSLFGVIMPFIKNNFKSITVVDETGSQVKKIEYTYLMKDGQISQVKIDSGDENSVIDLTYDCSIK